MELSDVKKKAKTLIFQPIQILGMRAYNHDSGLCFLKDGQPVLALEEERWSGDRGEGRFPLGCLEYIKKSNVLVDSKPISIVFPHATGPFCRARLHAFCKYFPRGYVNLGSMAKRCWRQQVCRWGLKGYFQRKTFFYETPLYLAHASSAYFTSPFGNAGILVLTGHGEPQSVVLLKGNACKIETLEKGECLSSLNSMYRAIFQYLGFDPSIHERKVWSLCAYGKPEFYDEFKRIIPDPEAGRVKIDLSYFTYHLGNRRLGALLKKRNSGVSDKFIKRIGKLKDCNKELNKQDMNLLASLQVRIREVVLNLVSYLKSVTDEDNFCLAGDMVNVSLNSEILKSKIFSRVFIQPVPFDAGAIMGSALYLHYKYSKEYKGTGLKDICLGAGYDDSDIEEAIKSRRISYTHSSQIHSDVARLLADGKIVGWFQGRNELGPVSLGNRSILADPRNSTIKERLRKGIKKESELVPFSASIIEEYAGEYFHSHAPSPFSSFTFKVKPEKESLVPAVLHADGTVLVHTVSPLVNPDYWKLLKAFYGITDVPILLNTSFNLSDRPLVNTPDNALDIFQNTDMDYLALNNFLIRR